MDNLIVSGARVKDLDQAIENAKGNAETTGRSWFVNLTTNGIRVEKRPLKSGFSGARTLYEVSPKGNVKKIAMDSKKVTDEKIASELLKIAKELTSNM